MLDHMLESAFSLRSKKLITGIMSCDPCLYFFEKKCSCCAHELSCLPAAIARHISSVSTPWENAKQNTGERVGQRPVSRIPNTFNVRVLVRILAVRFAPVRYPSRRVRLVEFAKSSLVISRTPRRYRVVRVLLHEICNVIWWDNGTVCGDSNKILSQFRAPMITFNDDRICRFLAHIIVWLAILRFYLKWRTIMEYNGIIKTVTY